MWIGSPQPEGLQHNIKWCIDNETMKILRVHFCPTRSTYEINENWDSKIQSAAAPAADEPVQKHKVTPGITGWLNEYICYKGRPLYFSKWAKAGVNKVSHMFDETIARPPHQLPVILSDTLEQGWNPLTCGCWQINSILANTGQKLHSNFESVPLLMKYIKTSIIY